MRRPPGPFQPDFWRSPVRGPRLTAMLGSLLLVAVTVVAVTGFLSHAAYEPGLDRNRIVEGALPLTFDWPTSPAWLYALTQGLHVSVGLATVPLLLAKLWSVIPRLFVWPPASSPAQALERAVVGLLVASSVFLLVTGVMNAQYWYAFGFDFVRAHYWAAVVFVGALGAHLVVKLPVAWRALRTRRELEPYDPGGLVAEFPAEPTISRRGVLAFAGGGALLVLGTNLGQTLGGPLREVAFLAPRQEDFPVNKRFAAVGIERAAVGPSWRLELRGGARDADLSRPDLLAMDLRTEDLPIACVEGWSTTQSWTGVPLRELARLAGAEDELALVESLQPRGRFRAAVMSADAMADERSLLALRVNGRDLSLDHGFPARVIVPGLPGVHATKWVNRITFGREA